MNQNHFRLWKLFYSLFFAVLGLNPGLSGAVGASTTMLRHSPLEIILFFVEG